MLAYKVDEALSKCKKELDKDEKNRVKNDLASLRRCLRKDKPEKMNETEEANLRQAKIPTGSQRQPPDGAVQHGAGCRPAVSGHFPTEKLR